MDEYNKRTNIFMNKIQFVFKKTNKGQTQPSSNVKNPELCTVPHKAAAATGTVKKGLFCSLIPIRKRAAFKTNPEGAYP